MILIGFLAFYIIGVIVTALYDWHSCKKHYMLYDLKLSAILALSSWIGLMAILRVERLTKKEKQNE